MSDVVGILLAAGSASRFGLPKLMQPLPDGTPIGVAAARALSAGVTEGIAVVRPDDARLSEVLSAEGLRIVENPSAERGIGASLAAGVLATAQAGGWLVALADMPWVAPATVRALAGGLRGGASMIAPVCQGRRGHPVGFAAHWATSLQSLDGDEGARGLIESHPDALRLYATDDVGVLNDVDRPSDIVRRD